MQIDCWSTTLWTCATLLARFQSVNVSNSTHIVGQSDRSVQTINCLALDCPQIPHLSLLSTAPAAAPKSVTFAATCPNCCCAAASTIKLTCCNSLMQLANITDLNHTLASGHTALPCSLRRLPRCLSSAPAHHELNPTLSPRTLPMQDGRRVSPPRQAAISVPLQQQFNLNPGQGRSVSPPR